MNVASRVWGLDGSEPKEVVLLPGERTNPEMLWRADGDADVHASSAK
ncbi:MAG: hypothetical protein R3F22_01600 [Lysobacteraceae bacterium]